MPQLLMHCHHHHHSIPCGIRRLAQVTHNDDEIFSLLGLIDKADGRKKKKKRSGVVCGVLCMMDGVVWVVTGYYKEGWSLQ